MDHADAVELIELAALEPDGLERLMAGDTPESAAVAGHLAGCPACVVEMARIRNTASAIREVIAGQPDPALRQRTLAFVREVGRDRSGALAPSTAVPLAPAARVVPGGLADPHAATAPPVAGDRPAWLRWGAIAAVVVLAAALGFGAASMQGEDGRRLAYELSVLERAARATIHLEAMPDTRRVPLTATAAGDGATGTLLFSPSSGELVMMADGLAPLADGEEYRCWMVADGTRFQIGALYPGGELRAWAATFAGLGDLPDDTVFGVSRIPADGGLGEEQLTGGL
ncbi:MAG TPA: anti-sigma factor [Candidatus Limnocylindrales bacterium]|nr:anti-sigma factor [Candidatus Limnocylindrales bacterium]